MGPVLAQPRVKAKAHNGAYLLATFDKELNVDQKWKTLIGQLAGLFCISLNQLDDQETSKIRYIDSKHSNFDI